MTTQNITIEQLAEKMNQTVWSKGEMKRIYLNDAGYNTKKMSTKTFIFQDENGDFKVSCKVECPSQGWQWIKSQEDEVKERVYEKIESAVSEIQNPEDNCDAYCEEQQTKKEAEEQEKQQAEINVILLPEQKETIAELVKLSDTAVIATGKQINDSGLFPHCQPSDKQIFLWIKDKLVTKKGYSWMPMIEIDLSPKSTHTHKIGDFYCILPTTEDHNDYCFEAYINKNCKITRILEPTVEMKDIRGNKKLKVNE